MAQRKCEKLRAREAVTKGLFEGLRRRAGVFYRRYRRRLGCACGR
ncbi:MAG: hypothetical protein OXI75_14020 [Rhodospirillales bacterium]|nr:hypothetical protein [Rhodospirillales bacterium]